MQEAHQHVRPACRPAPHEVPDFDGFDQEHHHIGDLAMPSYQSPTPPGDPTGRWLSFTAAVAVSAATRDWLAGKITRRRHAIRSRWRLLDPTTQATLVLAFLRTNLTHAELAAANHISASTCSSTASTCPPSRSPASSTAANSTTPVSTAATGSTCRPSAPPTGGCCGPRPP